jgi:uncharacterized membrane protein YdbT with pleckstrin-like domain
MDNNILYSGNPKMFRNRPLIFILCVILIIAYGLGLVILIIWWLKSKNSKLTITDEKVTLRTGIFSKKTNEVYLSDIRNVQVSQRFMQRITKAGNIALSTAGQAGIEIYIQGMKDPEKIKTIIDKHRKLN